MTEKNLLVQALGWYTENLHLIPGSGTDICMPFGNSLHASSFSSLKQKENKNTFPASQASWRFPSTVKHSDAAEMRPKRYVGT